MKHQRIGLIVAPAGSGKSTFYRVWQKSIPSLIDIDALMNQRGVYSALTESFGTKWWEDPRSRLAKEELMRACGIIDAITTQEDARFKNIILAADISEPLTKLANSVVVVLVPWDDHVRNMTVRELKGGHPAVFHDEELSKLRRKYESFADAQNLSRFTTFHEAYWAVRNALGQGEETYIHELHNAL